MKEEGSLSRKEKRAKRKAERLEKRAAALGKPKLFPENKHGYHIMPFMNFLRFLLYPLQFIFYPTKFHGNKKVGKGPCLYIGNHQSFIDIFYPAHTTKEGIHYLAKIEIMTAPILHGWGKRIGAIAVRRDGSDIRPFMDAMRVLKNGEKVAIYPEGTRNRENCEIRPFHGGAAMLAIKAKVPVVPVVVCNKPRFLHMTHVYVGEPFELSEYYDRKLTQEEYASADEALRQTLITLRETFLASRKKR